MSQRGFNTELPDGQKVMVLMGWDRPLRGFFAIVEKLAESKSADACKDASADDGFDDDADDDDVYLYSNLTDPNLLHTFGMSDNVEYFEGVLEKLGVKVPKSVIDGVLEDEATNAGNVFVLYDEAGNVLPQRQAA